MLLRKKISTYISHYSEYFIIEDDKIAHLYKFRTKKEVMYWKNVTIVIVLPYKSTKGIILRPNVFEDYDIVINNGIKGY